MEEITAEYAVEQLTPVPELRCYPRVTVAAKTDLGRVRENNEDKFEFYIPEDPSRRANRGSLFVVCDGMGGHAAGQIASELAAKTFIDVYLHHPNPEPMVAMHAGVQAAHRFVLDVARTVPGRKGMGTTLSALIVIQDQGYIVHVGDSRVYRLRGEELTALTVDHTWVHEALAAGLIRPEEAEDHPKRHWLMRAIGVEDFTLVPDVFPTEISPGDVFFLCSDGILNHVSDEEIGEILRGNGPSEAAWKLVRAALMGGGSDNATAIVLRVEGFEPANL